MKKNNTPAAAAKKLAKEIVNNMARIQAAEKIMVESRNKREYEDAERERADAACESITIIGQLLSEIGCVMTMADVLKWNEYYIIEKKSMLMK